MSAVAGPEHPITNRRLAVDMPGDPAVLVACSGGPDSVALAHLAAEVGVRVVALAHVDHGLRSDSAADADAVDVHARALGVPLAVRRVGVVARGSLEDAARRARWDALAAMAAEVGATVIATGHTMDDQAETVLMRLARGTGLTGAAGMHEWSATRKGCRVWRPLLQWRRADLRARCVAEGWEFVDDPTNTDRSIERNRVRLDVLPLLGARAVPALARAARLAGDDDDYLEELVAAAPVETRADGAVTIPLAWLEEAHPALARRAVRRAARLAGATYPPPADRIEDALRLPGVSLGGGVMARRTKGALMVKPDPGGRRATT